MRLSRYKAALLVITVLICNACTGNSPEEMAADGPVAGLAEQEAALQQLGAILPQIPVDPYVDPAQIAARRGSIAGTLGLWGHEVFDASAGVLVDEPQRTAALAAAAEFAWAIYRFDELLVSDNPNLLTVTTDDAALPGELYVGWASYTKGHWLFDYIEAPTGADSLSTPSAEDLISDGGSLYVAIIMYDDNVATVEQLTLGLDTLAPPPTNISASRNLGRSIELAWDTPPFAHEGTRIERALEPGGPFEVLVELSGAPGWYTDLHNETTNPIPYNEDVYYRFRTVTTAATGPPSITAIGRRLLPPVTGLTATDGDHPDKVELGWDSHFEANTYSVYCKQSEQGDEGWQLLEELNGLGVKAYEHTSASPAGKECANNQNYDYRVLAAYDSDAALEYSNVDAGYRMFSGPANVSASDGDNPNAISVTWDAVADATGYEVYRDSQDMPVVTVDAVTNYDDTAATAVFMHTYWVRATQGSDQSLYSYPDTGYRNKWTNYAVESSADAGGYTSLGLVNGLPAVSYFDDSNDDLKYARSSSLAPLDVTPWTTTDAHIAGGSGRATGLGVSGAMPVIFHVTSTENNLLYSRAAISEPGNTTDWLTMIVDDADIFDMAAPSAGVDVFNRPGVAYYESGGGVLKFAWATVAEPTAENQWRRVVVDDTGDTGITPSLSMYSGTPEICYHDATNGNLMFAYTWETDPAQPADWDISVVDDSANAVGRYCSLIVINGVHMVCYVDETGNDLLFAYSGVDWPSGPNDWIRMIVAEDIGAGLEISIADMNGVPAVCYRYDDGGTQTMRLAYATSPLPQGQEDWVSMEVHRGGTAGQHNSLLITDDNVIISWHDSPGGDGLNIAISQ